MSSRAREKIGDGLVKLAEPEKFSEAFAFSITFFVFSGIVYGCSTHWRISMHHCPCGWNVDA
jgi:hypothetical protein